MSAVDALTPRLGPGVGETLWRDAHSFLGMQKQTPIPPEKMFFSWHHRIFTFGGLWVSQSLSVQGRLGSPTPHPNKQLCSVNVFVDRNPSFSSDCLHPFGAVRMDFVLSLLRAGATVQH